MTHKVSCNAEYRETDYHFPRSRQDWLYVPLQRTPPVWRRWGGTAWGALVLAAMMAALLFAPAAIAWVLK